MSHPTQYVTSGTILEAAYSPTYSVKAVKDKVVPRIYELAYFNNATQLCNSNLALQADDGNYRAYRITSCSLSPERAICQNVNVAKKNFVKYVHW